MKTFQLRMWNGIALGLLVVVGCFALSPVAEAVPLVCNEVPPVLSLECHGDLNDSGTVVGGTIEYWFQFDNMQHIEPVNATFSLTVLFNDIQNLSLSEIYLTDVDGRIPDAADTDPITKTNQTQTFTTVDAAWRLNENGVFIHDFHIVIECDVNGCTGANPTATFYQFVGGLRPGTWDVPEPTTLALMGLALAGLRFQRRKAA